MSELAERIEPEDRSEMLDAVRETFRQQTLIVLEARGLASSPDLRECPRCGDRVILLDHPLTFAIDKRTKQPICQACRAEEDYLSISLPDAEIGGEGG